jgi:alpha-galactosidase
MLIVGVGLINSAAHRGAQGLNPTEERSMMSLWALMGAPLIMNADVRRLDPQNPRYDAEWAARVLPLFANHELIAIDQDALGKQGTRVRADGDADIWMKPLSDGSIAVGLLNRGDTTPLSITVRWSDLGVTGRYAVRDVWTHADLGASDNAWTATAAPHETVLLKLTRRSGA